MNTPWGLSQQQKTIAEGIVQIFTASHGGIHLSEERNSIVPSYMRRENGWYEEDCDWAIPALVFDSEFNKYAIRNRLNPREHHRHAMETLKNWEPDSYECYFNVKLKPGESYIRAHPLYQ